jgi:hypothetical protein
MRGVWVWRIWRVEVGIAMKFKKEISKESMQPFSFAAGRVPSHCLGSPRLGPDLIEWTSFVLQI